MTTQVRGTVRVMVRVGVTFRVIRVRLHLTYIFKL